MLNRRTVATAAFVASLFCTTLTTMSRDAQAATFEVGDFVTCAQQSWGEADELGGQLLATMSPTTTAPPGQPSAGTRTGRPAT